MACAKTCLILGAGASKPYGYPLGWQLKERIIQYCLSKPPYCAPREKLSETWHKLEQFARRFDEDDSTTIDAFLNTLPKNDELGRHGRMAIVAVLSAYEDAFDERERWYGSVLDLLEAPGDFTSLKVITFNYDRSFEFFVSRDIQRRDKSSLRTAREKFQQQVEIEHVYGCYATLPHFAGANAIAPDYGSLTGHDSWKGAIENIQLIGEEMLKGEQICRATEWIASADYIIILGFGFDHTNLNLIGLDSLPAGKFVFSSGFRLTNETRSRVRWSCIPTKFYFADANAGIETFLQGSRILSFAARGEPVEDFYRRVGSGTG